MAVKVFEQASSGIEVSVIIPVYNRARVIGRAIDSVLSQTGVGGIEVVVVDDGSQDHLDEALRGYEGRIKLIKKSNGGVSSARNEGTANSTGKFIAYLDSDDIFEQGKLSKSLEILRKRSDAGFVFSDFSRFDIEEPSTRLEHTNSYFFNNIYRYTQSPLEGISSKLYFLPQQDVFGLLLAGYFMSPCTLVMRRELYQAAQGWPTEFDISEDFHFFLRLSTLANAVYIDEPLISAGRGDNNLTENHQDCAESDISVLKSCLNLSHFDDAKKRQIKAAISDRLERLGWGLKNSRSYKEASRCYKEAFSFKPSNIKALLNYLMLLPKL
ncbi:glycosyltransferase family 2 protein [Hahella sp. CR1]|uniref:glycosyltransferase family 2 protein n=1 Tax=Hahella sp. CR1 TaxID=2992807 RepID=UPI0024434918|nr:glycosyltransferase family 2 protein [Hahella sp. CR1]MDG9667852.1 glycosyltransferase family 2 protein [Hahella sp. CR1]